MNTFLQTIVSGAIVGFIYGLIAVGFSLSYLTANVLNFAVGYIVVLAAYVVIGFQSLGVPLLLAIVIAAVIVGLGNAWANHWLFRPLYRHGVVYPTLCSFGLAIVIGSSIQLGWGAQPRVPKSLISANTFSIGGVRVSPAQFLAVGISIAVCFLLVWFLARTRSGHAMRLLALDPDVGILVGARTERLLFSAFLIGGVVAVLAGEVVAPVQGISPDTGLTLSVIGFAAAAVGGFGSVGGALIGGLVIGMGQNLVAVYISASFQQMVTFGLLILVILLRPQGLLGERQARARVV